jgi:hypothetical protein
MTSFTSLSAVAKIRADFQRNVKIPIAKHRKLKPAILCTWLSELTTRIQTLLLDFKASFNNHKPEEQTESIDQTVFNESYLISQINIAIRQLFSTLFIEALIAHAQQAYLSWLKQPPSKRKSFLLKEFQFCHRFGWTDSYKQKYIDLFYEIIEHKADKLCKGEYQDEFLTILRKWVNSNILPFGVTLLYSENSSNCPHVTENNDRNCLYLEPLLHNSLLQALSKTRATELFEIVADFPDSMVAIRELKEAANASSNMAYVGRIFKAAVCKRLLHTGAGTSQILEMYVVLYFFHTLTALVLS